MSGMVGARRRRCTRALSLLVSGGTRLHIQPRRVEAAAVGPLPGRPGLVVTRQHSAYRRRGAATSAVPRILPPPVRGLHG